MITRGKLGYAWNAAGHSQGARLGVGPLCLLLLSVFVLGGCSIVPQGKKWWNPTTWMSGRESTALQHAQVNEAAGKQAAADANEKAVHLSHIEFVKAEIVVSFLVTSPDVELAKRFMRNGLSLLGQVDLVAAGEIAEIHNLVQDLRSGDTARIAAGEAKQKEAELEIGSLSKQILDLQAKNAKLEAATRARTRDILDGFARENELADTYRNQRFLAWGAGIVAVLLLLVSLYLRMGLGSVGAALHGLPKLIGQDNAAKVITTLDTETDWFHQLIIGSARRKLAGLKAQAEHLVNS